MGNKVKKGLDYFPLYTDFFKNPKIEDLSSKYSAWGSAVYIAVLCLVYHNGYYEKFASPESLSRYIAKELSADRDQLSHTISRVTEVINYLIETGMLDGSLFEENILTSRSIQEQYKNCVSSMKRKVQLEEYLLIPLSESTSKNGINAEENAIDTEEIPFNSEEMPQIKGKESKEKEIKKRVRPRKKAHGEFKNVLLTDIELEKLRAEHSDTDEAIEFLSRYIERKGYKSKSHYLCILDWVFKALEERRAMNAPRGKDTYSHGGSFDTDDFFNAAVERSMSFDP